MNNIYFLLSFIVISILNVSCIQNGSTTINHEVTGSSTTITLQIYFSDSLVTSSETNLEIVDTIDSKLNALFEEYDVPISFILDFKGTIPKEEYYNLSSHTSDTIIVFICEDRYGGLRPSNSIARNTILIPEKYKTQTIVWAHELFHAITLTSNHTVDLGNDVGEYINCSINPVCLNLMRGYYTSPFTFMITNSKHELLKNSVTTNECNETGPFSHKYPKDLAEIGIDTLIQCCASPGIISSDSILVDTSYLLNVLKEYYCVNFEVLRFIPEGSTLRNKSTKNNNQYNLHILLNACNYSFLKSLILESLYISKISGQDFWDEINNRINFILSQKFHNFSPTLKEDIKNLMILDAQQMLKETGGKTNFENFYKSHFSPKSAIKHTYTEAFKNKLQTILKPTIYPKPIEKVDY